MDFIDRDHAVVHDATYTTCQRDDEATWQPAWMLRARTLHIDMAEEVGVAEGAALQFKGVTVLPVPRMSFPLSDKRKSGLLPPTMGLDKLSGIEYTQPYYWNLAPNRDMTLYPSVMSKRGVNLGAQFRYLEPTYSGEAYAAYMPGDRQRDRDRWAYSLQHRGVISSPIGGLGLNMNLNRVSDDNYWRDFPLAARSLRERLLPNDVNLSWARGDGVLTLRTLYWQTMQDASAPIAPPYGMKPQLQWRYTPLDLPHGLDFSFVADTTRFEIDKPLAGMTYNNGQRSYMQAQLSRPFLSPGAFITPRIQLHTSNYQVDRLMSNGSRNASRTLPTVSVDSGLVFERDTTLFGRQLLQTFEPRAFYTYTPYRDQSFLPLYDTARNDFNFASIYSENDYNGQDRIADNHLLTLGATTRLIDGATGAEKARFGIAQRVRFSDQKVILPGEVPATSRLSDVLLGAAINWTDAWSTEGTTQYNRDLNRPVRTTFGARYSPSSYRTVNVAYRTQYDTVARTDASKLVDVGWQWPINDLWGDKGRDLGAGRGQGGGRWYGGPAELQPEGPQARRYRGRAGVRRLLLDWPRGAGAPAKLHHPVQHPAAVPDRVRRLLAAEPGCRPAAQPQAECAALPVPARVGDAAQPLHQLRLEPRLQTRFCKASLPCVFFPRPIAAQRPLWRWPCWPPQPRRKACVFRASPGRPRPAMPPSRARWTPPTSPCRVIAAAMPACARPTTSWPWSTPSP